MENGGSRKKEEEQDGVSVHSSCKAPPSSASSLTKEPSQVELELKLLEALETCSVRKLKGVHGHFVLFGLMEYLKKSFGRSFTSDEVLELVDRFYNLDGLDPDEGKALFEKAEDFSLPQSYFDEEEP